MNEFSQYNFSKCPRCESKSYEILETHSYCIECNYSPDFMETEKFDVPKWALDELRAIEADSATATPKSRTAA